MERNADATGILLALATAAISGFSVFVNAYGVKTFGSATVYTTGKNVVAALVLVAVRRPWLARTGGPLAGPPGRGSGWRSRRSGSSGAASRSCSSSRGWPGRSSPQAAFIHKTLVLWVALLAVPLLRERLQWGHWAGDRPPRRRPGGPGGRPAGLVRGAGLMILAATLLWSVEVVVAKWLLRGVSSWTVARRPDGPGLGGAAAAGWRCAASSAALHVPDAASSSAGSLATGLLLAGYVGTWFAALARAQAVDVTAVLVLAAPVTAGLNAAANGHRAGPAGSLAGHARRGRRGRRVARAGGRAPAGPGRRRGGRWVARSSLGPERRAALRGLRLPAERAGLLRARRLAAAARAGGAGRRRPGPAPAGAWVRGGVALPRADRRARTASATRWTPRVVEAYWVGNTLLDRVGPRLLGDSLETRFRGRAGRAWPQARGCRARRRGAAPLLPRLRGLPVARAAARGARRRAAAGARPVPHPLGAGGRGEGRPGRRRGPARCGGTGAGCCSGPSGRGGGAPARGRARAGRAGAVGRLVLAALGLGVRAARPRGLAALCATRWPSSRSRTARPSPPRRPCSPERTPVAHPPRQPAGSVPSGSRSSAARVARYSCTAAARKR